MAPFEGGVIEGQHVGKETAAMIVSFSSQKHGGRDDGGHFVIYPSLWRGILRPTKARFHALEHGLRCWRCHPMSAGQEARRADSCSKKPYP
jgi:hypothetical protein